MKQEMLVGKTALIVIDIQKGAGPVGEPSPIPHMSGAEDRIPKARAIIAAARAAEVPVIFIQEAHRPDLVDFGRELDGVEGVHCLESEPQTEISDEIGFRPDDYFIRKRRYSAFFGTDLAILLKGVKAETLVLIGGLTDVCVHYTFVDAHQSDFYTRVVEDAVVGSAQAAHDASLNAMEYLQTGARRTTAEVLAAFGAMVREPAMA